MTFLVKSKAFLPSKSFLLPCLAFQQKLLKKAFPPVVLMVLQLPINFCQEDISSIIHWVLTLIKLNCFFVNLKEQRKERKLAKKIMKIGSESCTTTENLDFMWGTASVKYNPRFWRFWLQLLLDNISHFFKPSNHHLHTTKNQDFWPFLPFSVAAAVRDRDTHVF